VHGVTFASTGKCLEHNSGKISTRNRLVSETEPSWEVIMVVLHRACAGQRIQMLDENKYMGGMCSCQCQCQTQAVQCCVVPC
jgi:hypothetical protein